MDTALSGDANELQRDSKDSDDFLEGTMVWVDQVVREIVAFKEQVFQCFELVNWEDKLCFSLRDFIIVELDLISCHGGKVNIISPHPLETVCPDRVLIYLFYWWAPSGSNVSYHIVWVYIVPWGNTSPSQDFDHTIT